MNKDSTVNLVDLYDQPSQAEQKPHDDKSEKSATISADEGYGTEAEKDQAL
jgi:hypothetical protein